MSVVTSLQLINPLAAKSSFLNLDPLEVVSRYSDTQLQVGKNYSYLIPKVIFWQIRG